MPMVNRLRSSTQNCVRSHPRNGLFRARRLRRSIRDDTLRYRATDSRIGRRMLFRTIVSLLIVAPIMLHAGPGTASDYEDPDRAKCQSILEHYRGALDGIATRVRAAKGSREQQCALIRRDMLPTLERAVRLLESEPACRAKLLPAVFERARAGVERTRQLAAKACSARSGPRRDARASVRG